MKIEKGEDNNHDQNPDSTELTVGLTNAEDIPNFAEDPMDVIETWINENLPKDLQADTLTTIRDLREK